VFIFCYCGFSPNGGCSAAQHRVSGTRVARLPAILLGFFKIDNAAEAYLSRITALEHECNAIAACMDCISH
jgi:hypothetical protein